MWCFCITLKSMFSDIYNTFVFIGINGRDAMSFFLWEWGWGVWVVVP